MPNRTLMPFNTQFPDFPAADYPALPAGFTDSSWCNDACPSMTNEAANLFIFVDYVDPALREITTADDGRFGLYRMDEEGSLSQPAIITTNDWNEILKHL